ncbi:PAS domain S-box-containing protein [Duganella sp. SG902]|uniref:sensor histidine kinase n=1 Tax=Duganella sp. SG902 TaxID=2587016 RepID=UPI0018551B29|nr:ATP-binding protein [Duganella sp. SG902]NVM80020.1 PAS domain S-box-containing protein [Duganella sp. SG902]
MSQKQAPSVRASIAALVIASILPVASVAAALIVNFYAKERAQLIASSVQQARNIITAVDRDFDGVQLALQALATSRALRENDLGNFYPRAADMVDKLHADSIVLLDTDGTMLLSTRRPWGAPLPRLPKAPLLARILASGAPGVSDVFTGPITRQPVFSVAVPVKRDGAVAMTLNAAITPRHLQRLISEQQLPASWRASVIDTQGQIATRSHEVEKYAGRRLTAEQRRQLEGPADASFETTTFDGIDVFVISSRSPRTGWSALLGIPRQELTAGLRATLAWLVAATVAALAIGLGLAWLIGGRIASSIHALIPAARAVGEAGGLPMPPLHFREADELGAALHQAASDMRRARALTRESEQRLALAAEAAQLGIWIRDLRRQEIWISEQWRRLFGFADAQRVTLADLLARVHPDDRGAVRRTLDKAMRGAPRYEMEYRIVLPDGELRWIGSHGSVERAPDGGPALVRGVSLNITKRKLAELEVQQHQKEVTHLARVAMLGELSGALAHELNQPLTAILSNAQAARRYLARPAPPLDELGEIVDDIIAEDQRAGDIIQRLRRLFSKHEVPRQALDLRPLVGDVLRLLRNDLINHAVTVEASLGEAALPVRGDPVQLQQVLINLLMNACDAMAATPPGERRITLRAQAAGADTVRLSVADRGGGIPDETLARIFDPFYTTKQRGMGLGLSICRNILTAHEGLLWAENQAGGGACFHLCLPRAAAAPA